jgi:hypothetical protein
LAPFLSQSPLFSIRWLTRVHTILFGRLAIARSGDMSGGRRGRFGFESTNRQTPDCGLIALGRLMINLTVRARS